jgi:hypothetical protein
VRTVADVDPLADCRNLKGTLPPRGRRGREASRRVRLLEGAAGPRGGRRRGGLLTGSPGRSPDPLESQETGAPTGNLSRR